ncbi:MAG: precorrin-2 C(20)-methyltransferase, partial [Myxococcaceae bacterium]
EAARRVGEVLESGEDACFLTLGDPLLYSTYVYLLRALRARLPQVRVVTVPGVTAFCAAAALTEFPVGAGKEPVAIIPTADDLEPVRSALARGGTVVLMKVGKRLPGIIDLLEQTGALNRAVLVARAGLDGQRIETDLKKLREAPEAGYLSVILVHATEERQP